jgi:hypothetical protein
MRAELGAQHPGDDHGHHQHDDTDPGEEDDLRNRKREHQTLLNPAHTGRNENTSPSAEIVSAEASLRIPMQ